MRRDFVERFTVAVLLALLLSAAEVGIAAAQTSELGLAAGPAIPSGSAARERSVGPAVSVTTGVATSRWVLVRLNFIAAQLQGEAHPEGTPTFSNYGHLRVGGLFLQAVIGPRRGAVQPYAVVGFGPYWMKNMSGVQNPYGMVWGATVGAGMAWAPGRIQPFAELRYDLIASDFGAEEWSATTYVPIQVGFRWRFDRSAR